MSHLVFFGNEKLDSPLLYSKAETVKNQVSQLQSKFKFASQNETNKSIYGVISMACPCSRESLEAFNKVAENLPKSYSLKIFEISIKDKRKLATIKKLLKLKFDLISDPERNSIAILETKVTPSAYIFKGQNLVYASAVIDPAKSPSPNYLQIAIDALEKIQTPSQQSAFGCNISEALD